MSAAPGTLLLPNDAATNCTPQPFVSTNDTESKKTDQVINSTVPLSLSLAPKDIDLPDTPTVRALFLLSEESNDKSDLRSPTLASIPYVLRVNT